MSETPFSSSVHAGDGRCHNGVDFDLSTLSRSLENPSPTVNDDNPIYEDLGNYELKEEGDEPDLEESPDSSDEDNEDGSDEDDEVGGVELDLSLKCSSSTSASTSAPITSSPFAIHKAGPLPPIPVKRMPGPNVPKPGPAKLSKNAGLPEWLEEAKQCHYLPEHCMKQLCEMVKECLMEGASPTHLIFATILSSLHVYRIQHPAGSYSSHNLR